MSTPRSSASLSLASTSKRGKKSASSQEDAVSPPPSHSSSTSSSSVPPSISSRYGEVAWLIVKKVPYAVLLLDRRFASPDSLLELSKREKKATTSSSASGRSTGWWHHIAVFYGFGTVQIVSDADTNLVPWSSKSASGYAASLAAAAAKPNASTTAERTAAGVKSAKADLLSAPQDRGLSFRTVSPASGAAAGKGAKKAVEKAVAATAAAKKDEHWATDVMSDEEGHIVSPTGGRSALKKRKAPSGKKRAASSKAAFRDEDSASDNDNDRKLTDVDLTSEEGEVCGVALSSPSHKRRRSSSVTFQPPHNPSDTLFHNALPSSSPAASARKGGIGSKSSIKSKKGRAKFVDVVTPGVEWRPRDVAEGFEDM